MAKRKRRSKYETVQYTVTLKVDWAMFQRWFRVQRYPNDPDLDETEKYSTLLEAIAHRCHLIPGVISAEVDLGGPRDAEVLAAMAKSFGKQKK